MKCQLLGVAEGWYLEAEGWYLETVTRSVLIQHLNEVRHYVFLSVPLCLSLSLSGR